MSAQIATSPTSSEALRVLETLDHAGLTGLPADGVSTPSLAARRRRTGTSISVSTGVTSTEPSGRFSTSATHSVSMSGRDASNCASTGRVDVHPIVYDDRGHAVQTGLGGELHEYPDGGLAFPGSIGGLQVFCDTPELQGPVPSRLRAV